jgi:hypothetical protein
MQHGQTTLSIPGVYELEGSEAVEKEPTKRWLGKMDRQKGASAWQTQKSKPFS